MKTKTNSTLIATTVNQSQPEIDLNLYLKNLRQKLISLHSQKLWKKSWKKLLISEQAKIGPITQTQHQKTQAKQIGETNQNKKKRRATLKETKEKDGVHQAITETHRALRGPNIGKSIKQSSIDYC